MENTKSNIIVETKKDNTEVKVEKLDNEKIEDKKVGDKQDLVYQQVNYII